MAGKPPAFQFYVLDWAADLEEHPLEIEGAWIRICCKLWRVQPPGSMSRTLLQWAKILRVDEENARRILNYLKEEEIADISDNLSMSNAKITVTSRRMKRDAKERESGKIRQRRFYKKHQHDGKPNGEPNAPSSSSTSPSSKKKDKNPSCRNGGVEPGLFGATGKVPLLAEFLEAWNATGFQKTRAFRGQRLTHFRARCKDADWVTNWREALERIARLPGAHGKNDRGWIANVDWFLKASIVSDILEGKYDGVWGAERGDPGKRANREGGDYDANQPGWSKPR